MPKTLNGAGRFIRDWWHVGGGLVVITLAIGNLYWDVQQLKTADDKELRRRLEVVESRTSDNAMTDWYAWRAVVEKRLEWLEVPP